MSILDQTKDVERQRFFGGQRLFAADLQLLVDNQLQANELHNRSLHQPGVGLGFAVVAAKGSRTVEIGPGYAIDDQGREIVLMVARTEQVPAVDMGEDGGPVFYDLAVSYPADADLEVAENRPGLCRTQGAVRLLVEPIFCWVRLEAGPDGTLEAVDLQLRADIQQDRRIRIARAAILHCVLDSLSTAERRSARPPSRPYIRSGRVQPTWRLQLEVIQSFLLFLAADVDTRGAGFRTTPAYFARIVGPRLLTVAKGGTSLDLAADGLLSIDEGASATGFSVLVLVLAIPASESQLMDATPIDATPIDATSINAELFDGQWSVEWMGVE